MRAAPTPRSCGTASARRGTGRWCPIASCGAHGLRDRRQCRLRRGYRPGARLRRPASGRTQRPHRIPTQSRHRPPPGQLLGYGPADVAAHTRFQRGVTVHSGRPLSFGFSPYPGPERRRILRVPDKPATHLRRRTLACDRSGGPYLTQCRKTGSPPSGCRGPRPQRQAVCRPGPAAPGRVVAWCRPGQARRRLAPPRWPAPAPCCGTSRTALVPSSWRS